MSKQDSRFNEAKVHMAARVIWQESCKGTNPISYSKFAEKMGMGNPHSRDVAFLLDAVQELCEKTNLPSLAALVGRKNDSNNMPGEGFFESYANHYFENEDWRREVVEFERDRVSNASMKYQEMFSQWQQ